MPGIIEDIVNKESGVSLRRLTTDEYDQLGETGILHEEERVELIEGLIIEMAPVGDEHEDIVDRLNRVFGDQHRGRYRVRVSGPIRIADASEPQPDVTLYESDSRRHPVPEEIRLVIEVADSSVPFDTGAKKAIYERAQIPEYWVIELPTKQVRIYRLVDGGFVEEVRRIGSINCQAFPDVTVDLQELF
ncbi:MAG: Uma2 family endonuclease [Verrucomicrobia bacterium]|nr:Uma2 family endonuclease [Verrucomicrobiota bacterium]